MKNMKKYNKFLEVLRTKNFKDLDTWSTEEEQKITKKKSLNKLNGKKLIAIFNKYNIHVDFYSKNYTNTLHKTHKFVDENDLKEIRLGLYSIMPYEKWIDYHGHSNNDIENLQDEYVEYLNNITSFDGITSFSVFLSSNFNDIEYCVADACNYLTKKLKNITKIFELVEGDIGDLDIVKNYVNNINLTINNDNLDIIGNLLTRLRMDSKVFYHLKDNHFDSHDLSFTDFITDLKKI